MTELSVQARRIRERRIALKMSQEELAEAIQTVQATISRYERGENDPSSEVLATLAKVLNTSSDWLLGLTDQVRWPIHSSSELTELEQNILDDLRSIRPNHQQVIANIIKEIISLTSSQAQ